MLVGTIVSVEDFPEARKPTFKLWIDFGSLGVKKSSSQITELYSKQELVGKQVLCVTNFPPKQVANFQSEVLTTGFVQSDGSVILAVPDKKCENCSKLA